ncbi:MAG: SDR family NAD(P)-dependent oxidoreductase, partial [Deltaproteobacteria bacterium]|nr:SDR family NAD(P)-dependent oxidoreductase [Deltaproteobacteria bacterium]
APLAEAPLAEAPLPAAPLNDHATAWSHLLTRMTETPDSAVTEVIDADIYAWRAASANELNDACDVIGQQSSTAPLSWTADDVLVAVGATGITARIAIAFAQKHKSPIALLDIDTLSTDDYLSPRWDDEHHDDRRKEIHQQLLAQGGKVRPVDVEKTFSKALKQREMQQTVKAIEDAGAAVMFSQCDVTQLQSVHTAFDAIRQKFSRINGVIHGAGIEQSALLEKKTKSDFFRIIDPKVSGAFNLISCVNDAELKLWVCFSSISGVFGNAAQVDYSAANSFLNFFTLELQRRYPTALVRSMAWSGWAETGMAWRNSYVRENAEKIGLHLIPPSVGTSEAVALMSTFGGPSVQILHRGLGHMLNEQWRLTSGFPQPLIDKVEKTDAGFRFFKTLDIHTDEWLNQHRLVNVPLLPAVGYLEMLAEIHCWQNPFGNGISFENLVVHDAFKLYNETPRDIYIDAIPKPDSNGDVTLAINIHSEIKGRLFTDTRLYFSGDVRSADTHAPEWADVWTAPEWTHAGGHFEVFDGIDRLPKNVVFGHLYHDFKRDGADLTGMVYQWNDDCFMRDYGFPMEGLTNPKYRLKELRINFCLMDSLHQAGVVHTVLQTGKVHLPVGAKKFIVYNKCDQPQRLKNYARCTRRDTDLFEYDIFLVNKDNIICAAAYGVTFRKIS